MRGRHARGATSAIVAAALGLLGGGHAGCSDSSFAVSGDGGADGGEGGVCGTPDDHDNCGTCGKRCGDLEACDQGQCVPGCPDRIIYVSPEGKDSAGGCTPATAKRSIAAAIAFAKGSSLRRHEIRACAGEYVGALTLDYPVSIRGGYSCQGFNREASTRWPDFTSALTVIKPADATQDLTVTVTGASVGSSIELDGLDIRGNDSDKTRSVALVVGGSAQPHIHDCKVSGGNGTSDAGPGSIAVLVFEGAAPEITHDAIDGGSGTSNATAVAAGSVGVLLAANAGKLHLHSTRIFGGRGRGTTPTAAGSTGVLDTATVALAGASAIEDNLIEGGAGTTTPLGIGVASVGIALLNPGEREISANRIEGGAGVCAGPATCVVAAITHVGASAVRVAKNRVYAGDATAPASVLATFVGVSLQGSTGSSVIDNFILAGNRKGLVTRYQSYAITLQGTTASLVLSNTIGLGVTSSAAVSIAQGDSGSKIDDNLVVGSPGQDVFLGWIQCAPPPVIGEVFNNVLLGFSKSDSALYELTTSGATCDTATVSAEVKTLEAKLNAAAGRVAAAGNMRIASSALECGVDDATTCTIEGSCTTMAGCTALTFAAWDAPTGGYTELVGPGWKLRDTAFCPAMMGGRDLSALVPDDAYGAKRTVPFSVGAHENDALGCLK